MGGGGVGGGQQFPVVIGSVKSYVKNVLINSDILFLYKNLSVNNKRTHRYLYRLQQRFPGKISILYFYIFIAQEV